VTVEPSWERFVLLMQAAGVDGVFLPGRNSPEFWKPFGTDVLAGHVPVVWEDRDTRLYEIPRRRRTQVHSIPGLSGLEEYVAAIEDERAPGLEMEWVTANRGRVKGSWRRGDRVLIHMNWHREWTAYLNGRRVPTGADGLGQMVVVPDGEGELELVYEGSWRTRWMALLGLVILAASGRGLSSAVRRFSGLG
jgi:hypothetical protein